MEEDIKRITANTSLEIIQRIISHYSVCIADQRKNVEANLLQLENSAEKSRYLFLKDHLNALYESYLQTLQAGKLKKIDTYLNINSNRNDKWIPSLGLTEEERSFITNNEQLCDKIVNAMMSLVMRDNPLITIQSTSFTPELLEFTPCETLHIHHNGQGHFVTSSSIGGKVRLFDSLNRAPTDYLMRQIRAIYSPDPSITPEVHQCKMVHQQAGGVDCGIFAIAYAIDLCNGIDPSTIFYDQSKMREHLFISLTNKVVERFPVYNQCFVSGCTEEVTHNIPSTEKWSTPKRSTKHLVNVRISPVKLTNRFAALASVQKDNNNYDESLLATPLTKRNTCTAQETSSSNSQSKTPRVSVPVTDSDCTKHSNVIKNLTHDPYRPLSRDEVEVLEMGLTFSPSRRFYNKESLTEDMYWFVRKLKLKEYFFQKNSPGSESDESFESDTLNDIMEPQNEHSWEPKNPEWYPEEVRYNRSQPLTNFIKNTLKNIKYSLNHNNHRHYDNLSAKKRQALEALSKDCSIVIKQSDKCGSIVIMNTSDYENGCLQHLLDKTFYEEVNSDPNIKYSENVQEELSKLRVDGHITYKQYNYLTAECRTPAFYGLPKMHKAYDNFPSLRPICSGTNSPTAKLSQFIDTFLKPIAQATASYIKDTTHFILRIKDIKFNKGDSKEVYLVTMDVTSLYPNIDHQEGTKACFSFLELNASSIPAVALKKLILLVLQSNTMAFMNRFFHQVKGTAMGTGMAVNYANLFMASFEDNMLKSYFDKTGIKPTLWLRFIDDIFFIWEGSEQSLTEFLSFCNNFSEQQGMKSCIKFTYSYSSKSVNFLDTTVSVSDDGTVQTDLYAKPTAAYQYLHQSSYHDPHLIRAIPKSQFIRIRRICSSLQTYWLHANNYIKHFSKRGYEVSRLRATASEIASQDRAQLLSPREKEKSDRIPLVVTYHHKFREFSKILHNNFKKMIAEDVGMKKVFPEPPMIAFKRNPNIKDKLVRAKHWVNTVEPLERTRVSDRTKIKSCMNEEKFIENKQNGHKCKIEGGLSTDQNVVYAAECLKHNLIYVGVTTNQLNCRMNRHRSDITHYPDRCELSRHFSEKGCDFEKDLKISVLEHVRGTLSKLKRQEDKWVTRLGTKSPTGLNVSTSEFGYIYKSLFH